jgi:hypothetical protein
MSVQKHAMSAKVMKKLLKKQVLKKLLETGSIDLLQLNNHSVITAAHLCAFLKIWSENFSGRQQSVY